MKKYQTPEAKLVVISVDDILAQSQGLFVEWSEDDAVEIDPFDL